MQTFVAASLFVLGARASLAATAVIHDPAVIALDAPPVAGYDEGFAYLGHVWRLSNGNVVVIDSGWGDGVLSSMGAVYLYDADGTLFSRLTGQSEEDWIGSNGIVESRNGYFIVLSSSWNGQPLNTVTRGILFEFAAGDAPAGEGEHPWAFEQQPDGGWVLVGRQQYSADTGVLSTYAQKSTNYTVTIARWFLQRMPWAGR